MLTVLLTRSELLLNHVRRRTIHDNVANQNRLIKILFTDPRMRKAAVKAACVVIDHTDPQASLSHLHGIAESVFGHGAIRGLTAATPGGMIGQRPSKGLTGVSSFS